MSIDAPGELALVAILVVIVVLVVFELWAVRTHRRTISEYAQRMFASMDRQLVAGIFFLLGALAGWFIAHFTSSPPG